MKTNFYSQLLKVFLAVTLLVPQTLTAQDQLKSGTTVDGDGASLFRFEMDENLGIMQHVKFVVYLDANKNPSRLVFQNTQLYAFHSDYLMTTKEFAGKNRAQIDELTLKDGPDRKAILGTLFNHMQTGQNDPETVINHSFELVTDDVMPVPTVKKIFEMILKSSPETVDKKSFSYMASGKNKKAIFDQTAELKEAGIRVHDIFKNKDYQAYVQGWNVGIIKVIRADEIEQVIKAGGVTAETILVTDFVPREIPPIKGLISVEPTAMSSHVALLAEMLQIPFASDRKIMDKATKLDGQKVFLDIGPTGIERLISVDDLTYQKLAQIKLQKPLDISVDFNKTKIVQTKDLKDADIPAYGGKSVRLGLLKRQIPEKSPTHSVAIPVVYFKKYIETAITAEGPTLIEVINTNLKAIEAGGLNYAEISGHLEKIRSAMKSTAVPPALLQEIRQQLDQHIPKTVSRVKLRSSSNVEDGAEFNGAGLYDSEGVWLNNVPEEKTDSFAKGLNKVWRSFYSDRGFLARQAFKVDESKAAMGILVQDAFKGELANGVALYIPSQNEWSADTVKVIGFPGEETTVTNPKTPDQPEIIELNGNSDEENPDLPRWTTRIEQRTNLLPVGQTIMAEGFYMDLADQMKKVAKNWPGKLPKSGLDFEWKLIEKNNKPDILIKQVRPLVREQKDQLPAGASHFIVGGFEETLDIDYPEMEDAFGQHFCPEKVAVTLPTFADSEIKNSIVIPSFKISLRGKNYEFQNIKSTGQTGVKDDRPYFSLDFSVDTDVYKGLRFSFASPYNSNGGIVVHKYNATVRGSEKDLAQANKFFPYAKVYVCHLSSPLDYGVSPHINPEDSISKINAKITAKDGSVSVKGEYKFKTGYDKTSHYILTETVIEGFGLKSPLKITSPRSSVYGGAHHNFSWGVSVDMAATDLPDAEKLAFYKKYGRYFMFSTSVIVNKQNQAVWLKPDGTMGKTFKAIWSSAN